MAKKVKNKTEMTSIRLEPDLKKRVKESSYSYNQCIENFMDITESELSDAIRKRDKAQKELKEIKRQERLKEYELRDLNDTIVKLRKKEEKRDPKIREAIGKLNGLYDKYRETKDSNISFVDFLTNTKNADGISPLKSITKLVGISERSVLDCVDK